MSLLSKKVMKTTETRCVPQRVIAEINEQISKVSKK